MLPRLIIATVLSIAIAVPVGQAFDGTLVPLCAAVFVQGMLALMLVLKIDDTEA